MHHKKRLTVFAIHHHFRFFEFKGMQRWIRKLLEIKTLKMCDGVISPNPYTTDLLMRFMPEKNIKNLRMSFAPQTEDSHPQKGEFLYVGTIYKRKGVHKLIEALSKLYKKGIRDFNLNLVGSIHHKEYVDQIKQLIVSNHLENNIHILGRVSRDELGELYSNAEWFILPSQHEGYGMVIAEAMSYGVPVIAFDNSAIPYIVKDNVNGLLVKDGDINDLARAIEKAHADTELRTVLSDGARTTFVHLPTPIDFRDDVKEFMSQYSHE